jgi:hypothetical protein
MISQLLLTLILNTPLAQKSCLEIQQMIDQLSEGGGVITLEAATYLCDSPIVISRDNIRLVGMGPRDTIIKSVDGKAMPVVLIGDPETKDLYPIKQVWNVEISNLSVIGSWSTHLDPENNECYDFQNLASTACSHGEGHLVRNNGITVRGAHDILISNVETSNHLSGGIVLEKISSKIVIDGFWSFNNYFDGFAGYETTDSLIRNFELSHNQYSGISVDLSFEGNIFENGAVFENQDNGVFSAQVGRNIYRQMKVINNKKYGFYFEGSRRKEKNGEVTLIPNSCDENYIERTQISGGEVGIYINHACENLKFKNLEIENTTEECISYFPGSSAELQNVVCKRGGR